MSNKRILNLTSRKKRNTMLAWSNTTSAGAARVTAPGAAFVAGNSTGRFLWCATAQDLTTQSGGIGSVTQPAQRTASICFMRGLSENLRIQTSSGLAWFHRRICFTNKGSNPFIDRAAADTSTPLNPATPLVDTSNGVQRLWLNMTINGTPNTINERYGILFKGAQGVDWDDELTAPVDTTRISLKFDRTWTIRSGNANGTVAERKLWHPMNHNLAYDEDETGSSETTSYFSQTSKLGMGDYYVLDIITPGQGGTSSDLLLLSNTTSLYWHEK